DSGREYHYKIGADGFMISFTDADGNTTIPEVIHVKASPPPAPSALTQFWSAVAAVEATKAAGGGAQAGMGNLDRRICTLKYTWFSGLADPFTSRKVLTNIEVARIESRIHILQGLGEVFNAGGSNTDASILAHLEGDLRTRLLFNKRMREIEPVRAQA